MLRACCFLFGGKLMILSFEQIKKKCEKCGHDEASYYTRQVFNNHTLFFQFPLGGSLSWFCFPSLTDEISRWRANYFLHMYQMPASVSGQLNHICEAGGSIVLQDTKAKFLYHRRCIHYHDCLIIWLLFFFFWASEWLNLVAFPNILLISPSFWIKWLSLMLLVAYKHILLLLYPILCGIWKVHTDIHDITRENFEFFLI